MERVKGIEPSSQPWEGHILPLNHTRIAQPLFCSKLHRNWQLVNNKHQTDSKPPMASVSFISISFSRAGEIIFPSATSLT